VIGVTVLLEPADEIGLLLLFKLRERSPLSTNQLVRIVHLQKSAVLQTLQMLVDSGLVRVEVVKQRKMYSLIDASVVPKIEFGAKDAHGLSIEKGLVKKLSLQQLSLHPSARVTLEKKRWHPLKNQLSGLYYSLMDRCGQTLHLFLAELVALDVLYQAGVIDTNDFKKSYEKLRRVYLEAYLSRELSDVAIKRFIQELYSDRESIEAGNRLAKEFKIHLAKH